VVDNSASAMKQYANSHKKTWNIYVISKYENPQINYTSFTEQNKASEWEMKVNMWFVWRKWSDACRRALNMDAGAETYKAAAS
jgi:hypothetical protein